MLSNILRKLNEPFPEQLSGISVLKETLFIGLFVALFLYIFNPFGLQNMPQGVALSSAIFGLITVLFSLLFKLFVVHALKIQTDLPSWTLLKWLIMTSLMVCWVAIGNFTFLIASLPNNFGLQDFPKMLQSTIMVGITPIVVSGMLIQLRAARKNTEYASQLTAENSPSSSSTVANSQRVNFTVSNGDGLDVAVNDILAIEAMQNYLMVFHYSTSNQSVQQTMIRSTLANALAQLEGTDIRQCHRSYLVNLSKVDVIDGNAQGLKLTINGLINKTIPVSRRYISVFK